jgi:hypothetical protein
MNEGGGIFAAGYRGVAAALDAFCVKRATPVAGRARLRAAVTGPRLRITRGAPEPGGATRQLPDVPRITALAWKYRIGLAAAIAQTYACCGIYLAAVRH